MWLEAHLRPEQLHDADDLTSLKVTATKVEHVWLTPEEIARLAGDRAQDAEWQRKFAAMLEYAASKGWIDENGAVRAHVEWS